MYLVKKNELAQDFVNKQGFEKIRDMLIDPEIQQNGNFAYNLVATLWVLSFHEYTIPEFASYQLQIIEHVVKILDFFNKEKIVRIICRLFDVSNTFLYNKARHKKSCFIFIRTLRTTLTALNICPWLTHST